MDMSLSECIFKIRCLYVVYEKVGNTALMLAACYGSLEVLNLLIQARTVVDMQDKVKKRILNKHNCYVCIM
jgi:hypothetical protein